MKRVGGSTSVYGLDNEVIFAITPLTAVFHTIKESDDIKSKHGTGFFIENPYDSQQIVLVTNRHVIDANFRTNKSEIWKLNNLSILARGSANMSEYENVLFSKDDLEIIVSETEDIALIFGCKEKNPDFLIRYLDRKCLGRNDEPQLRIGSPLTFIGYPENLYNENGKTAIARNASLACLPNESFKNSKLGDIGSQSLIINGISLNGGSGSPIFFHKKNNPTDRKSKVLMGNFNSKIIGVVSGHFNTIDEAKHMGISYFVKIEEVVKLLKEFKTKKDKDLIHKGKWEFKEMIYEVEVWQKLDTKEKIALNRLKKEFCFEPDFSANYGKGIPWQNCDFIEYLYS